MLTNILKVIYSVLSPTECFLCEKAGSWLCKNCEGRLRKSNKKMPNFVQVYYDYEDENVRKVIHSIKYSNHTDLAVSLGEYAKENIKYDYDYVIPVPISSKRMRERGYNQAEYIARGIDKNKILEPIERIKHTHKLFNANSIDERTNELEKAFVIKSNHAGKLKNKTVLIVDDITTTGATFYILKNILEKEGAVVKAFALAH